MKMLISVGRFLKRKTMLVWLKENIIKNFGTCKSLCNLQQLCKAFKEKHPNVNIAFSKLCAWIPKWRILAGSKITHPVCVCSAYQHFVLLVDAMDWDLTYKDLIKKIVCNIESNKCIMHRCEPCPSTATLKEFLDQELSEHEDDEKFNYCHYDTTDRTILTTFTVTYEQYKETLINVIEELTRHSCITKLKISSSWYRTKSKSYQEYCKLHLLVVYYLGPNGSLQRDSLCFSSDDSNHYTSFWYQFQTWLVSYLKTNHPHIIKN